MPDVNPEILRWARETAGLESEEAVEKLQLRAARGQSALERLAALEAGDYKPSRAMLVRMARHYRRPLLAFYLSAPPRRGDRGQDFRTLPESHSGADDALLDVLIRDVRARQSMVRALMEDEEEAELLPFISSLKLSDPPSIFVKSIRSTLQVSVEDFYSQPSPQEAFGLLRRQAESVGVFVLLMGNLGTYHTAIDLETFRGFALADDVAPFVVINDQDSRAAWSFTLVHELTHLWLGQTGVSGYFAELAVERFCNDVAGEFLLPADELQQLQLDDRPDEATLQERIGEFAAGRNVSGSMVAYSLYRKRMIEQEVWKRLSAAFRTFWSRERTSQRDRARDQEGGPNYYVVRRHRLGRALTDLVGQMVTAGALTSTKAAKVLGVKPKQVQVLLDTGEQGGMRSLA